MSDQQLVTGLSIMISAYSRLDCGISVYHWKLITTLAWFSSATHLATLLFLRQYMHRNRLLWYVRVLLMTGLVAMLAVAIVATGVRVESPMPAKCAYDPAGYWMYTSDEDIPMIISDVILLGGFLIRLAEMSSIVKRLSGGSLRTAIGKPGRRALAWLCKRLGRSPRWVQALFIPLVPFSLAFLVMIQAVLDFLGSDICGVGNCPCYVCYMHWF
jgi:hypothetical protein